ncbi:MAG: DUF1501 domain-containing protein [Gammaproteobacteria bacterium]|nr:DUF1501 domain-containing protein [Gammaproteobacteria bacterium]
MERRNFLKVLTGFGMAGALPMSLVSPAWSAEAQRFLITVNAAGGWDPTSLIDPKGNAMRSDGLGPINHYGASAIKSVGNLRYAAYPDGVAPPAADSPGHLDTFFAKHYQRLLVVNGIDTQTNGHETGTRFVWSGRLEEGYPTVAALAAAPYASQPMAFISNGGYDFTGALVAPVRTASAGTFTSLAYPNSQYPDNPALRSAGYFSDGSYAMVDAARQLRLARQRSVETLPRRAAQMAQLETVRSSEVSLDGLLSLLPAQVSDGLKGQAEVAIAAFASGLAVSANLNLGGFDTHGSHDDDQTDALTQLLEGVDHLWEQIVLRGLQNKVTVVIGSDFGRTPFYNTGAGKDHWNITSIMAMGAGITGNRVIGGTDVNFEALNLHPDTLEVHSGGIIVTPRHVHRALRDFIGVSSELDKLYPLNVEKLALFA